MLRFTRRLPRWSTFALVVAVIASTVVWGEQPTLAQAPNRPSIDAQAFNACTTTDYASIAAKSLNITPVVLRKDIVGGQTLQQIATAQNVSLQTVVDAVQAARKADIDQAVKDGVVTQAEATVMEAPVDVAATQPAIRPTPGGNRPARPQGGFQPQAVFPDISTFDFLLRQAAATESASGNGARGGGFGGFVGFGGVGAGTFNLVRQYEVAAQALNMKCTDLVKTLITPPGQSIMALAAAQKVDPQTISAALTKAYQSALAQDVTDAIITQAQSDQLSSNLDKAVTAFIGNPLPMGPQATRQAQ
jgi:hypothetical protein